MKIVLVGASGFLGRHVLHALGRAGHDCTVLTRDAARRRSLALLPWVRLVQADVQAPDVLDVQLRGADAVFSMAGILNERGRDGSGFRRVHVELVKSVLAASARAGVRRVLHVSAIGAGQGESHYLRSKGEAERLLEASPVPVSVFRPSVVFGPGDSFFNRFAALLRLSPVLPLACPESRLQPVFAGDVASAMATVLARPAVDFEAFELGGPEVYSLRELVAWTARQLGLRRWIVGLPRGLSRLQGALMDFVPGKPFSSDNFLSLQCPNVARGDPWPDWGLHPASIASVVPFYLARSARQQRLADLRRHAGRD